MELNIKGKAKKLPEENTGEHPHELGVAKAFLDRTQKTINKRKNWII